MSDRIGILSLGCARNLVDSEIIAGRLRSKGYKIVDIDKADTALVNTCAFIKEAKEESIQTILDLIDYKREGRIKKIIVSGCLSQRYKEELAIHLPEVDAFQGVISLNHTQCRFPLSPQHYAYVKICEGCFNRCSFCVIPNIKPRLISRHVESIIDEIKALEEKGLAEINLIGQEITAYGKDLYGEFKLAYLIKQILKNCKQVKWLRLLYLSPERLNQELIELIASSPRIVKYIDLPLQHINNRLLRLMNRNISSFRIYKLIDAVRKKIKNVAIRTSLIVGFPTETDKEFKQLLNFIQRIKFERLGLFMYSREEGTDAYSLSRQISQKVKQARYNTIMSYQQDIARKINEGWRGKTIEVLIEEKQEDGVYIGRSQHDAPEVDGLVFVKSKRELSIGNFVDVKINDTLEYDLVGEYCEHS